jgi:hypothetical protein
MTHLVASAAATALLTLSAAASAGDCAAPPVTTADHAVCLARQFAEKPKPPPWELEFKAKEAASHWLVYYGPKPSSGVRGGAGDLQIEKKSGEVRLLRGYR